MKNRRDLPDWNHAHRGPDYLTLFWMVGFLVLWLLICGCSLKVMATSPTDGNSQVSVDKNIYVVFNRRLDPESIQASAFELTSDCGAVETSAAVVTPNVVRIDPMEDLLPDTGHRLSISNRVTSKAGIPIEKGAGVRFTTVGEDAANNGGVHPPPPAVTSPFQAGIAEVDMTPPVGVPLAGYGGGKRRRWFPDLDPDNYYTFLTPSKGVKDPLMAKALVLGNQTERVCIVTLDTIGTDEAIVRLAHEKATAQGFTIPLEKVLVCSSHTHSGPGAIIKGLLWQVVAADLYVDEIAQYVAERVAQAMVGAQQNMEAVSVGIGKGIVTGASKNRRSDDSPDLDEGDVDPELYVVRVDRVDGTPLATLWNFAIHGTHFGPGNLYYSADIMGAASKKAQDRGAGICLFINGAEGDIKPVGELEVTSSLLSEKILMARQAAQPVHRGILQSTSQVIDMGDPYVNLGLQHLKKNTRANWLISALSDLDVNPGIDFRIPHGWTDRNFRFQAIRLNNVVFISMPGEPIHEIGLDLKQKGKALGFDHVIPAGLANGHGGYFTTPTEYNHGGYEAMVSMFGPLNGVLLKDASIALMEKLKP